MMRPISLHIVDAGATTFEAAVPTLKYPPVGTGMADLAGPLDQCIVGLDHLE